jgi:hypothetical protein
VIRDLLAQHSANEWQDGLEDEQVRLVNVALDRSAAALQEHLRAVASRANSALVTLRERPQKAMTDASTVLDELTNEVFDFGARS